MRRVVAYESDYQPVMEPVLVAIDLKDIALSQITRFQGNGGGHIVRESARKEQGAVDQRI